MKIEDIQIGKIYHNGKDQYRRVIEFTNTLGKIKQSPDGSDIQYVRCDSRGNEIGNGIARSCWCSTFASWAKGEVKEGEKTE